MELNWSTFVLEIINFLVLVWILKRFLYQPVLDVIAARRQSVEEELAQARDKEKEAQALKEQYTGRLEAWETEKRKARDELADEMEKERARRLSEAKSAVERENEKARVAGERRQAEKQRALERQAMQQGATFASRLLEQAAGPELEDRLLSLLVDELQGLSDDQRARLLEQWPAPSQAIDVSSAFDLSDEQRERLTAALGALRDSPNVRFRRDEALIAGLRLEIGAWALTANLRDELRGFMELASEPR